MIVYMYNMIVLLLCTLVSDIANHLTPRAIGLIQREEGLYPANGEREGERDGGREKGREREEGRER